MNPSPAPAKPEGFDQALSLIAGRNLYGQPKVRCEWGWGLRTFRNGDPQALKYPGEFLDFWILEQWVPSTFFGSRKQWEANRYVMHNGQRVDLLGEYPSRGEYIMIMPLMSPDGQFKPLSDDVLTFVNMMRRDFESRVDNVYASGKLHAKLAQKMAQDQAELELEAAKEAEDFRSQWRKSQFSEREYSKNLWTPQGEVRVH